MKWHLRQGDFTPVQVGGSHHNCTSLEMVRPDTVGSEKVHVDILTYKGGGYNELRSHDNCEQIYCLMKGKMKVRVYDEECIMEPGDMVYIPRNAPHCHENVGGGEMTFMLISVFHDR